MPRKAKKKPEEAKAAGGEGAARIEVVEREAARQLLTIEPDDSAWATGSLESSITSGALVRVRPPADASDEAIAGLRETLRSAGAAAVKVLPRAAGTSFAVVPEGERERKAGRTIRQVVMERAEAAVTADRPALLQALDEALSEVGL